MLELTSNRWTVISPEPTAQCSCEVLCCEVAEKVTRWRPNVQQQCTAHVTYMSHRMTCYQAGNWGQGYSGMFYRAGQCLSQPGLTQEQPCWNKWPVFLLCWYYTSENSSVCQSCRAVLCQESAEASQSQQCESCDDQLGGEVTSTAGVTKPVLQAGSSQTGETRDLAAGQNEKCEW